MSSSISIEGTAVPGPVARVVDVMSSYPRPWALCGGWALDASLGRISRSHGDVDVSVFDADHEQLAKHLAGWQLIAHNSAIDDGATALWDGRRLPVPSHIHARAPEDAGPLPEDGVCEPAKGWWLDIQIDGIDGGERVLNRDPRISLPLAAEETMSPWRVRVMAPEAILFYKAAGVTRRRDHEDFLRILPKLTDAQRVWLAKAIVTVKPEHAWLSVLDHQP